MNIKILKEKESKFLGRKELELEATYDAATPTESDVKKKIASLAKSDENLIAIKKIDQSFGMKKAVITAYVYNDLGIVQRLEKKKEKKKKEVKEEKKEEAK